MDDIPTGTVDFEKKEINCSSGQTANEVPTGSIYLIKNRISSKIYVGMTCKTAQQRFAEHVRTAKRGIEYPLYCAIRKYGADAFDVSVLEVTSIDALGDAEMKWIAQLNAREEGYNISPGGNGFVGHAPGEMRQKIASSLRGHIIPEETRQKISQSLKGKRLSEEHRNKIRESLADPECQEKRSASSRGRKVSPETCQKISDGGKAAWQRDGHREKMRQKRTGSGNSRAVLTEEIVRHIKNEWKNYDASPCGAVKKFCDGQAILHNVSPAAIFRLIRGHSWKHVE